MIFDVTTGKFYCDIGIQDLAAEGCVPYMVPYMDPQKKGAGATPRRLYRHA